MSALFFRRLGEGPPLVVLHGLFGSGDNLATMAREWAHDRAVYLVDQRDHGRSPHTDRVTYDLMAGDLLELLDAEGIGTASIVGHSMGGKTAMRFAQLHADRLGRLVVIDIGPREYPPGNQAHIVEALVKSAPHEKTSRKDMEEHLARHVKEPGVIQFLMKSLYWETPERLAWRFNVTVLARDMQDILAAIGTEQVDVPTLFIRGGQSDYILREDLPQLHEQFTHAKVEVVPFAGHWVHAQAPDEVIDMVRSHITSS